MTRRPGAKDQADTFVTNRRWLLGERTVPLGLERVEKLGSLDDHPLTAFARGGHYYLKMHEKTHLSFGAYGDSQSHREFEAQRNIELVAVCSYMTRGISFLR
jgi:hypothetical protein